MQDLHDSDIGRVKNSAAIPFFAKEIVLRDPRTLKPRPGNPRKHSKRQIKQIRQSILGNGFLRPPLIDSEDYIVAGHGCVAAAIDLNLATIPTIKIEHLTPAQIRAYVIADNKLAENSEWDDELLAAQLKDLLGDLDGDLSTTGFSPGEIEGLLAGLDPPFEETDPLAGYDRANPPVSRPGDIWWMGQHRLICGDATKPETYDRLMAGEKAEVIFTDPPYNVPINGHVSGLGKTKHPEFACASGEMSPAEFTAFLTITLTNLARFSADGSIHFVCMDWRHLDSLLQAARGASLDLKNICVWAKTNAGMGSLYRSQHEFVFVLKNGTAPHINNVELGKHGRSRTNLWTYAGANAFGKNRNRDLAMHPTVKPVELVADAIRDCSHRNGLVLDAFAGSGTTLVAAEKTARRAYAIEIDPHYVDTVVRRMQMTTGLKATLEGTKSTFQEISTTRAMEANNV